MMHEGDLLIAFCTFAFGLAFGMSFAVKKAQPSAEAAPASKVVATDVSAFSRPGWTMSEAREQADEGQRAAFKLAPKTVLEALQRGNVRFWTGSAQRPEKSAFERRALINKQFPSTAILSCSDSRVPTEIVFDQNLGDMFVCRCAGNAVTETTMGSLQYAVNHLKVKVLIVMGHEGCGAVKAAGLPEEALRGEPSQLCNCLLALKDGLDFNKLKSCEDSRAHDREAVVSNVKQQVMALTRDKGIMKKVDDKEIMIIGAFYEISSGIVDFFFEVSKASPKPAVGDADEQEEKEEKPPVNSPSRGVLSAFDPASKMERQSSREEQSGIPNAQPGPVRRIVQPAPSPSPSPSPPVPWPTMRQASVAATPFNVMKPAARTPYSATSVGLGPMASPMVPQTSMGGRPGLMVSPAYAAVPVSPMISSTRVLGAPGQVSMGGLGPMAGPMTPQISMGGRPGPMVSPAYAAVPVSSLSSSMSRRHLQGVPASGTPGAPSVPSAAQREVAKPVIKRASV